MGNISEAKLKYLAVMIVWIGMFILAGLLINSGSLSGDGMGWMMGSAAFVSGALATGVLLKWGQIEPQSAVQESEQSKRKNDQRGLDPISLLTEEDLAELREEVKYDLRRRLLQHEEGEMNTLDALVADSESHRRR